jgi:ankyrin repeat protein
MMYLRRRLLALLTMAALAGPAAAGSYDDFFEAVEKDNYLKISQLLSRGFDANTRDPQGQHGLYLALRTHSLNVAKTLMNWPHTDYDARNEADETPLMMACLKGQLEIVRGLIARKVDVNKTGWTPLHYAATGGHREIIRVLLDEHAYIDAESPNGTTPLMMAAKYADLPTVQLLLDEGADAEHQNQLHLTAADFAQAQPDIKKLLSQRASQQK